MARSTVTLKQALADARMLAGATDYARITDPSMITKYNLVNARIYKLLNGAKYKRFAAHAIASATSATGWVSVLAAANATYTAATKVITNANAAATWVGGIAIFTDATYVYLSDITAVSVGVSFTVRDGPVSNITAGNLSYMCLIIPDYTTPLDIVNYRIDNILRVHFTHAGTGVVVNEDVIESVSSNPNFDYLCAYCQTGHGSLGDSIKIKAGASTTNSGGFPIIFFEEKPYRATAVTDYVDLPTEYHAVLIEEIARLTLIELGSKIPKALENPLMTLEAISQSFQATVDTFAQSRDVPG